MEEQAKNKDIAGYKPKQNAAFQRGKNWLILIAINEYQKKPLNNCKKDAEAVRKILQTHYYFNKAETRTFYDEEATLKKIDADFRYLISNEIAENDNVVIYYSGHGVVDEINDFCWVTIEAESNDDKTLYITRSQINNLLNAISRKNALHIFLIVDSCFAGTMGNYNPKAYDIPLDKQEMEPSRWALYSARKELASDGVEGGHSPFAQNLIDILKENTDSLRIGKLGQMVKDRMKDLPQTPVFDRLEVAGHAGGEMVLHLREKFLRKYDQALPINVAPVDILAHLPIHADIPYPELPFKGLRWFEKSDARIFFGRKQEINNVHQFLDNTHDRRKRLILLYGPSGAGKSSFLFAGLLPRLPENWQVEYRRRGQDGSALEILQAVNNFDPEQKAVLIIDQLEEIYNNPGTTGVEESAEFGRILFEAMNVYPKLYVVLSFREEFLGRITNLLNQPPDIYTSFVLNHLNRSGIYEALTGVVREAAQHYRDIRYEDNELPHEIAQHFVSLDAKTHTPLVQYLLRRMWDTTSSVPDQNPLVFTRALYKNLQQKSIVALLDTQLKEVGQSFPDYLSNGLLNDLMFLFVSSETSATSQSITDIQREYSHLPHNDILNLCKALEDAYLLSSFTSEDGELHYRLGHDALALPVLQRFMESEAPGQVLTRALNEAIKNKSELSQYVVKYVGVGRRGRRKLSEIENELLIFSWKKYIKIIAKDELTNNNIKEAIQILWDYIEEFEPEDRLMVCGIINSRYDQLYKQIRDGEISQETENIKSNILKQSIVGLIKSLQFQERVACMKNLLVAIKEGNVSILVDELKALKNTDHEYADELNYFIGRYTDFNKKHLLYRLWDNKTAEKNLFDIYLGFFTFLIDRYILSQEYYVNVLSTSDFKNFAEGMEYEVMKDEFLKILEGLFVCYDIKKVPIVLGQFALFVFLTRQPDYYSKEDIFVFGNRFLGFLREFSTYHGLRKKINSKCKKNIKREVIQLLYNNNLVKAVSFIKNFGGFQTIHYEEFDDYFKIAYTEQNSRDLRIRKARLIYRIIDLIAPEFETVDKFVEYLNGNIQLRGQILEKLKNEALIEAFGTFDEVFEMKAPITITAALYQEVESQYQMQIIEREEYNVEINRIRQMLLEVVMKSFEEEERNESLINRFKSIKDRILNNMKKADEDEVKWAMEDLSLLLTFTPFAALIIHQIGRYKNLQEDFINRKIDAESYSYELYGINSAILHVIKEIEEYLTHPSKP